MKMICAILLKKEADYWQIYQKADKSAFFIDNLQMKEYV